MDHNTGTEIIKATPAAAALTAKVLGIHLPDVVQALTAVYLFCLCVQFGYRFVKWIRAKRTPA